MAGLGVASVTVLRQLDAWWWLGLQRGFRDAGVALIAGVAIKLGSRLAPADDALRRAIVVLAVCSTILVRAGWIFPLAIAVGGILTLVRDTWWPRLFRAGAVEVQPDAPRSEATASKPATASIVGGGVAIVAWIAVLVALISARSTEPHNERLAQAEIFWRIASLVFGDGQVVIPQLVNELSSWISVETFLLGFAWVPRPRTAAVGQCVVWREGAGGRAGRRRTRSYRQRSFDISARHSVSHACFCLSALCNASSIVQAN